MMNYDRLDETELPSSVKESDKDDVSNFVNVITIKILIKEKSYQIVGVKVPTTVSAFKNQVSSTIPDTPVESQRLIFNGRLLQPDNMTLDSFGIKDNAVIHLFPRTVPKNLNENLPMATTVAPDDASNNSASSSADGVRNPMQISSTIDDFLVLNQNQAIHLDPTIYRSSRDIKSLSYILVLVSSFQLFGFLATSAATGALGMNVFDGIVQFTQAVASAMGIYVGYLGIYSVRSLDLQIIRKYVYLLAALAAMTILIKFVWVADEVVIANNIRLQQERDPTGSTDNGSNGDSNNNDHRDKTDNLFTDDFSSNGDGTAPEIDIQGVVMFGVQAFLVAGMISTIWVTCVVRAFRFRDAVQAHSVTSTVAQNV